MLASVTRGLIHGSSTESVLLTAWCSLLVFACVGYVVGRMAGWIVEESVRATVVAELATQEKTKVTETNP
jgi:hypothetical protein